MIRCTIPVLFALVATPAFADEASKSAKVAELLDLMMDDGKILTQMLDVPLPQAPTGLPIEQQLLMARMSQQMMDAYKKAMAWDRMRAAVAPFYKDAFSEAQIDDLLVFYRSPTGRALIAKQPEMSAKTVALMQQVMVEVSPEIDRITREFTEELMRVTQETPPAAAPPSQGPGQGPRLPGQSPGQGPAPAPAKR